MPDFGRNYEALQAVASPASRVTSAKPLPGLSTDRLSFRDKSRTRVARDSAIADATAVLNSACENNGFGAEGGA